MRGEHEHERGEGERWRRLGMMRGALGKRGCCVVTAIKQDAEPLLISSGTGAS